MRIIRIALHILVSLDESRNMSVESIDANEAKAGVFAEKVKKFITAVMVAAPFVGLGVGKIFGWPYRLEWWVLGLTIGLHYVAAGGVTVGFHRYLTHRAFKTFRPVRILLACLGSLAIEGPVLNWVAFHRQHHDHTDEPGDPHSPHVGMGAGILGVFKGLWHAHVGWLFSPQKADRTRYAKDLLADPAMRLVHKLFPLLAVTAFLMPFGIGFAVTGTFGGALVVTFWAGLVRMGLTHHVTWSINSVCHMFGTRPFAKSGKADRSTNLAPLALVTLGESYHHNHHAQPTSAYHGFRW
jgi:stearoyl-CoA desaturase (Delta-9 desaturase)